jgi:hypothetical protein
MNWKKKKKDGLEEMSLYENTLSFRIGAKRR